MVLLKEALKGFLEKGIFKANSSKGELIEVELRNVL